MTRRARVLGLVAVMPATILCFWAQLTTSWNVLGIEAMDETFGDLRQITATAGCAALLSEWDLSLETCDPFDRPFNYPSVWVRVLASLGITESSTEVLGLLLMTALLLSLWWLCSAALTTDASLWSTLYLSVLSISPPVLLLAERGNSDIVVFVIVMAAAASVSYLKGVPAAILLAAATVLKIFPIGAVPILWPSRQGRLARGLVFCILVGLNLLLTFSELALIAERTPQSVASSFGAPVIFSEVGERLGFSYMQENARSIGLGVAFLSLGLITALLCLPMSRPALTILLRFSRALARDPIAATLFVSGGGPFVVSFLVGTNWDYRLVFLLPVVAGILRLHNVVGSVVLVPLALLTLTLWGSVGSPKPLQAIGDLTTWLIALPLTIGLVCVTFASNIDPHGKLILRRGSTSGP